MLKISEMSAREHAIYMVGVVRAQRDDWIRQARTTKARKPDYDRALVVIQVNAARQRNQEVVFWTKRVRFATSASK